MNKRKPRVFVASTFKGLKDERKALELVFNKYKDGIDYWGYESWVGSGAPDMKSSEKARESDYLILILGDRYGTRSIRNNKSITQNEYEEFLYSHSLEIAKDNNTIHAFEKDVDSIKPEEAEVPGPGRIDLRDFSQRVKNRHTIPPQFKNWRELQNLVYNILKTLPRYIEDKKYQKLSIKQFEFQILGSGKYREENIKSNWSNCPCNVMKIGACEYIKKLHYRPPEYLRIEMERYLEKTLKEPDTNPRWRENVDSFKTVNIIKKGNGLLFDFCCSNWWQFFGTNQAAPQDEKINEILKQQWEEGYKLSTSPFSNNLGFSIAIINKDMETLYYTIRSSNVSIHAGKRSTGVGTQLHAFDNEHIDQDGKPNIFNGVRRELVNEAKLDSSMISDLYIVAWGIGRRTGTPELLFVCETKEPLSKFKENVVTSKTDHHDEFDQLEMHRNRKIVALDYEVLADMIENKEQWEPESAVACCLALNEITPDCISFD